MEVEQRIKMHKEMNEAFAVLLDICLKLHLRPLYGRLKQARSFMALMLDDRK